MFLNITSTDADLYDWDIIAYVGIVYSITEDSIEEAHARTYAEIKKSVSPRRYQFLIGENAVSSEYIKIVARDPQSFAQQLPFYSVKPLYPAMLYLLSKLNIDIVPASILISQISYLLIGGLLMYWLTKYYPIVPACLLTIGLVSIPFVLLLATYSGPDGLSVLLVLLGLFLFTETKYLKSAIAVLLISITARPDNIILIALLAFYSFTFHQNTRKAAVGTLLISIGIYLGLTGMSGNTGWETLFYHTYIQYLSYPLTDPVSVSFGDYLNILAEKSKPIAIANTSYSFILFLLLNVVALQLRFKDRLTDDRHFQAILVVLIYSCVHWFLFPNQKERLLAACFLFTIVSLLIGVRDKVSPIRGASIEA